MKKYLLSAAAVAAVATATPALARDGSGYFGIEGGLLLPTDRKVELAGSGSGTYYGYYDIYDADVVAAASFKTKYKKGLDIDAIAGYDFGGFRVEAELGWKGAKHDKYKDATAAVVATSGGDVVYDEDFGPGDIEADGHTRVFSVMANVLADFGNEDGLSFYAGGGLGWSRTKFVVEAEDYEVGAKDSGLAWQLIAGARYAVSPNVDLGLKYRYFRGNKVKDAADLAGEELLGATFDEGTLSGRTRFASHSLLASLIFNFGAQAAAPPPPPPPAPLAPPPPAPATQTCPDGSVVLVTDSCPLPPPPPAPPPPAPERG